MQNYNLKFKILTFLSVILIFTFLIFNFVEAAGLVPCGECVSYNQDGTCAKYNICTWCHLMQLVKNIIDFIIYNLVFPISAVMIVIGGGFIMMAGDSESRVSKGKEILTAAVVGLLIALTSWIIINTIMGIATGYTSIVGRPWNELQCK